MSKIALTPNASGTGVFTIASPATNTDRTLTLPDEAGTVLTGSGPINVNASAPNQTVTVDASGNVGIGTSSPNANHKLTIVDVSGNGGGTLGLNVSSSGSSDNLGRLHFGNATDPVLAAIFGVADGSADSGALTFRTEKTGEALEERMRIDSAGRVLINYADISTGLATSKGLLQVANIDTTYDWTQINTDANGYASTANEIAVINSANNDVNGFAGLFMQAGETADAVTISAARIGAIRVATNSAATDLAFAVRGGNAVMSEAMRIDSSGALLVGTTGTIGGYFPGKVHIDAAGTNGITTRINTAGEVSYASWHSTDGGTRYHCNFYDGTSRTLRGSITSNGSSTSYNTSSDYRLKTDAQPMTGASDRVLALKPVNFEWISSGERVDGFLAHEAQEIVPEAVHGTKDAMRDEQYEVTAAVYEDIIIAAVLDDEGNELEAERTEQRLVTEAVMGTRSVPDMQGIDQSKLVPLLTAALQEALTEISALKVRVAALEAV